MTRLLRGQRNCERELGRVGERELEIKVERRVDSIDSTVIIISWIERINVNRDTRLRYMTSMIIDWLIVKYDWLLGLRTVARAESVTPASQLCHELGISLFFVSGLREKGTYYGATVQGTISNLRTPFRSSVCEARF